MPFHYFYHFLTIISFLFKTTQAIDKSHASLNEKSITPKNLKNSHKDDVSVQNRILNIIVQSGPLASDGDIQATTIRGPAKNTQGGSGLGEPSQQTVSGNNVNLLDTALSTMDDDDDNISKSDKNNG